MNINGWKRLSAEQISQRILYVLTAVTVLVFGLFYSVGFDRLFIDNPDFNAPLFTDVLLGLIYFMLFVAFAVGVCALVGESRKRRDEERVVNGIPKSKISLLVFGGTFILLALFGVLGSSEPIMINGRMFTDRFWLKATDLFINTSLVLLLMVIVAVIYGATRYYRKKENDY